MDHSDQTLKTADDLVAARLIDASQQPGVDEVAQRYAIALTPTISGLIDRDDPSDPIARQFVPNALELSTHAAELSDPIGDDAHAPIKGVVHRYRDRALLKVAGTCPVYCRFCFRREMIGPGFGQHLTGADLDDALGYFESHPEIWEVILTGGDPLVLSARRVRDLTARLSAIDHVKVLRWHTRVPIVAPERITTELIKAMSPQRQAVYAAIHVNHVRELTPEARDACQRLRSAGINLVSQSVLLKGVNDDADTLEALMRTLVEASITPYYLHHGDLAPGTRHFRATIAYGLSVMSELRRRLSGLALPNYVIDLPGGHGKIALEGANVSITADGSYEIRDRNGKVHSYRDACD